MDYKTETARFERMLERLKNDLKFYQQTEGASEKRISFLQNQINCSEAFLQSSQNEVNRVTDNFMESINSVLKLRDSYGKSLSCFYILSDIFHIEEKQPFLYDCALKGKIEYLKEALQMHLCICKEKHDFSRNHFLKNKNNTYSQHVKHENYLSDLKTNPKKAIINFISFDKV